MTAQTVTAICAIIVAIASLVVSIWTSAVTRKHHRLSVTPHLRLDHFYSLDEGIKVNLVNNGLGTAIIKNFAVCVDGVPLSGIGAKPLAEALATMGWKGGFYTYTPTPDDALSVGERIEILSFPLTDRPSNERDTLRTSLSRVTFRINYESMYRDKFV